MASRIVGEASGYGWRSRGRVVGVALGLAMLIGVAEVWAAHPSAGPVCPARPRVARPTAFHFSPGLKEHQSWIEFGVPEPDATAFTLCLDGRLWATGVGETPRAGLVRVNVTTTFVDTEWLLGGLAAVAQPARWQLGYTTYSLDLGHRPSRQD